MIEWEKRRDVKGSGNRVLGTPLGKPPLFLAPRPSWDFHVDLRPRPELPTRIRWLEQWCHLADYVGADHGGGGGGDPSLEGVLMTGWSGASAPSWAGQLLPPPPSLQNPASEPLGRDPTEDPEGTPNLPRPHLTAPGGQSARLDCGKLQLSLLLNPPSPA